MVWQECVPWQCLNICCDKSIAMATIKVTARTRDLLLEYAKDDSINDGLVRLLQESERECHTYDEDKASVNIRLDPSTLDELKRYKLTPSERHSDTILRLLLKQMSD